MNTFKEECTLNECYLEHCTYFCSDILTTYQTQKSLWSFCPKGGVRVPLDGSESQSAAEPLASTFQQQGEKFPQHTHTHTQPGNPTNCCGKHCDFPVIPATEVERESETETYDERTMETASFMTLSPNSSA